MNIRECYSSFNGDFDGLMARLLTEERIIKFFKKVDFSAQITELDNSLALGDYENAFRQAHTIKGVAANLSLGDMERAAIDLTEALRGGPKGDVEGLLVELKRADALIREALSQLD